MKDVRSFEAIELEPSGPLDAERAFTRLPAAKSAVRLSRYPTIIQTIMTQNYALRHA